MPSVLVVPVYVEVPDGFERAVTALEAHLRRAGYAFYTGEPLPVTLEETKRNIACSTNGRGGRSLHRKRIICWSSGIEISLQTVARTSLIAPELAAATRPKADCAVSTAYQVLRDRIG